MSNHRDYNHQGLVSFDGNPRSHHASSSGNVLLDTFLEIVFRFLAMPENSQINQMVTAYNTVSMDLERAANLSFERQKLLWRIDLFQSISRVEKILYLQQLRELLPPRGGPIFDRIVIVMPYMEPFVRSIRRRSYDPRFDGNWFCWWRRSSQSDPAERAQLEQGNYFARHLLEYEVIEQLVPALSNQLPPISDSRRTAEGESLPSVIHSPVFSSNIGYVSLNQAYAGSSVQYHNSRDNSGRGRRS
ncbi:hypothetical protein F5Y02DRAFT_420221 [Annulohypoxylon stygium]|nr:hypothetical protein F5Y02DRAFT_420221 [Annulohypoxylon stygium]